MRKFCVPLTTLFAFFLVILLFENCKDPTSPTPTETELEGTWVGTEVNGGSAEWTFIFTEKTAQCSCSTTEWYKGNFNLNTSTVPKEMNLTITQCSVPQFIGLVTLAIYKISKDTLTFAGNSPGNQERPASFNPVDDTRVFVAIKQ